MHITHRVGKFIVRTDRVVGNPDAGETYLTLVTRENSFWAVRMCYNAQHAADMHHEMVTEAQLTDPELCVKEALIVEKFKAEGERIRQMLRRQY